MVSLNHTSNYLINNHASVKDASALSGYSMQYIRRLLRLEQLSGIKIGQVWLVEIDSLNAYLTHALNSKDQRFSPKQYIDPLIRSYALLCPSELHPIFCTNL